MGELSSELSPSSLIEYFISSAQTGTRHSYTPLLLSDPSQVVEATINVSKNVTVNCLHWEGTGFFCRGVNSMILVIIGCICLFEIMT